MTIGEKIKQARKSRGLTQKQLAEQLSISITTLQNYESGKNNPTVTIIEHIAEILDIPTEWLIKNKENRDIEIADEEANIRRVVKISMAMIKAFEDEGLERAYAITMTKALIDLNDGAEL